ncbi:hypothetical protein RRG08_013611 [Elysia crispata]|uniref:Uncharacterized protein n=1 Tax=Elysia crispata TaxID=231223 RepID=A0AAE1ANT3_9GAST|nr:hypothetical protein RRG08_013611 [Elysia crispata]
MVIYEAFGNPRMCFRLWGLSHQSIFADSKLETRPSTLDGQILRACAQRLGINDAFKHQLGEDGKRLTSADWSKMP